MDENSNEPDLLSPILSKSLKCRSLVVCDYDYVITLDFTQLMNYEFDQTATNCSTPSAVNSRFAVHRRSLRRFFQTISPSNSLQRMKKSRKKHIAVGHNNNTTI